MRNLAFSLLGIAAKTDNSKAPFQTKKDRMWERVVRETGNPNVPYAVWATFSPKRNKKDNSILIEVSLEIPDPEAPSRMVRVPARPHILVDGIGGYLPYLGQEEVKTQDGTTRIKLVSSSHLCLVLNPIPPKNGQKPDPYRVLPFALGSEGPDGALTKWNAAARTSLANATEAQKATVADQWPIIEPFAHALDRDHRKEILFLNFQPTCYALTREDNPDSDRMYGAVFGQMVVDRSGGQEVPEPDKIDEKGNPYYGGMVHTFRIVQLTEKSIGVTWEGSIGTSQIKRGALKLESYTINGFQALGLEIVWANPLQVMDQAMDLADSSYDAGNCLYLYALGRGEVFDTQTRIEIRNALRQIARSAAEHVQRELKSAKDDLVNQFSTAILPTLSEALAGGDLAEVWYRESGPDDVVANWISERVEGEFFFDSWLHSRVRTEVLRMIVRKDGIEPPARPKKEVPKVEEPARVEVPASIVEAAAEEKQETTTPVEVPKRGKKTKKIVDAAAPTA
jgi:hypothetical protein